MRVVVIDDVKAQAISLARAIRNRLELYSGFEIISLSTVAEIEEFTYGEDIYIIDEHLFDGFNPGVDESAPLSGNKLANVITQAYPKAKVIIFTGDSDKKEGKFLRILKTDREMLLKQVVSFI